MLCVDGSVWACGAADMCGLGGGRSGHGEQTQFARIDFGAAAGGDAITKSSDISASSSGGGAISSVSASASASASASGAPIRAKLISMGSRLACVVAQDNRLFVVCVQSLY